MLNGTIRATGNVAVLQIDQVFSYIAAMDDWHSVCFDFGITVAQAVQKLGLWHLRQLKRTIGRVSERHTCALLPECPFQNLNKALTNPRSRRSGDSDQLVRTGLDTNGGEETLAHKRACTSHESHSEE